MTDESPNEILASFQQMILAQATRRRVPTRVRPSSLKTVTKRDQSIVTRFVAGESYLKLALDYGIATDRIIQVLRCVSRCLDPERHDALRASCTQPPLRIPEDRLRMHLHALLAEEENHDKETA